MRIPAHSFIFLGFLLVWATTPGARAFQDDQGAAPPEIIYGVTAAEMDDWFRGFGWESEILEADDEGRPNIQIKFNDYTSFLKFRHCTTAVPGRCSTLLFFANFDLGRRISANDPEVLNNYNDRYVMGRAYYLKKPDEDVDQIGVDFRISVEGGVTGRYLALEAVKWEEVISDFVANFTAD